MAQLNQNLLSASERRILLCDIARIALAVGRDLSKPLGAVPDAVEAQESVSPLERLRLIEALWPRMTTALAHLAKQHTGEPRMMPTPTPLPSARGGQASMRAVASRPGPAAAWAGHEADVADGGDGSNPVSIEEIRPHLHRDTRDNRFVAWLLTEMQRECGALGALAHYCGETREARTAHRIEADAAHWRRRAPYRELTRPSTPTQIAQAAGPTSAPAYRALRSAWRTLGWGSGFDWSHSPLLRLPTAEPWHLYEIWCTLQAGAALRRCGWRAIGSDLLRITPHGLVLAPVAGAASQIRFQRPQAGRSGRADTAALIYRPYFRSADQQAARTGGDAAPDAYRSRSHTMQPDIALERNGRLLLLDAKYKSYESGAIAEVGSGVTDHTDSALLTDLDKMHAYRDAILRGSHPAVAGAWCLFPGASGTGPRAVAYPASTESSPFGAADLGAIRLRPGEEPDLLDRLVERWLNGTPSPETLPRPGSLRTPLPGVPPSLHKGEGDDNRRSPSPA